MDKDFLSRLIDATELVRMCADGEIELRPFVDAYGNFYYREALDGHEGGLDIIQRYRDAVELHQRIQEEVVNKVYIPSGAMETIPGDRLSESDGARLLREIAADSRVADVLFRLRNTSRDMR